MNYEPNSVILAHMINYTNPSLYFIIIIFNDLYQAIRNNIVVKMTTEFVLFFHKKTTKLIFLWIL